jgi:hypothetical protein
MPINRAVKDEHVVRDAVIVHEVVAKGRTLQSVADDYGLTRERVRQIVKAGSPQFRNREVRKARTRARNAERRRTQLAEGEKYRTISELPRSSKATKWTKEQMLAEMCRLTEIHGGPIGITEWRRIAKAHGAPSAALYVQRFGSWNRAKELAGLQPIASNRPHYVREFSDEDILRSVALFLRTANRDSTAQRFGSAHYEQWRIETALPYPSAALARVRLGRWHEIKAAAIEYNRQNFDE